MRAPLIILRHELDTSLLCNYSCELNTLYSVWHLKPIAQLEENKSVFVHFQFSKQFNETRAIKISLSRAAATYFCKATHAQLTNRANIYFMIIPSVLAFQLSRDKVCRQNKIGMEMRLHDTLHSRLTSS